MFHCPVGVWVIEQHAIILSATVRSPTVNVTSWETHGLQYVFNKTSLLFTKIWQQLYQTNSYLYDDSICTNFLAGYPRVLTSIYIYTKKCGTPFHIHAWIHGCLFKPQLGYEGVMKFCISCGCY